MKKPYEKFEMEIFLFKKKDVVTASSAEPRDIDNSYVNFTALFNDFFTS